MTQQIDLTKTEWEAPKMEKLSLKDAESGTANANDDGGTTWS